MPQEAAADEVADEVAKILNKFSINCKNIDCEILLTLQLSFHLAMSALSLEGRRKF